MTALAVWMMLESLSIGVGYAFGYYAGYFTGYAIGQADEIKRSNYEM